MLGKGIVAWCLQRQKSVLLSITRSEYIAISQAIQELTWLMLLMSDLLETHENKPIQGGGGRAIAPGRKLKGTTMCQLILLIMLRTDYVMIVDEIIKSKYFGIVVDSTPDLVYIDQLLIIYVIV